jgi:hypothetical protein
VIIEKKSYIEQLRALSKEAFETEDYKTLKEIRLKILQKFTRPSVTNTQEILQSLSVEELRKFQKEAQTALDIWMMLEIEKELKNRKNHINTH